MYMADFYTVPGSLAGVPSMSIPCGFGAGPVNGKRPVGLQLIANYFDEARMLGVAHAYQTRHRLALCVVPDRVLVDSMSQRLLVRAPNARQQSSLAARACRRAGPPLLQDRAVLLARLGRVAEAERTLAEAEQQMPADAPRALELRFAYVRAIDAYFSKRFARRATQCSPCCARPAKSSEPTLIAECESALALFMQREGDVRAAVAHARSVLANGDATLEARYRASLALASLHQDAHDYETAYRLYRETHDRGQGS